jgi:hypothetical protein
MRSVRSDQSLEEVTSAGVHFHSQNMHKGMQATANSKLRDVNRSEDKETTKYSIDVKLYAVGIEDIG